MEKQLCALAYPVRNEEDKMEMVVYGIGSIESVEPPRLAILLKRSFDWIRGIELFDPIISLTESKVLTSLARVVCKSLAVSSSRKHVLASRSLAEELRVDTFLMIRLEHFMVRVGIFLALC
ncbi:hypothetical protein SASPL_113459 [Salvia splendens]|uniref:SRR1-like domain-containing protein n=1 Tax=Salvia splendens TaxID=180675 RepID=A0A8X8XYY5_SALSN|nr:hypothetical protein SASPL_113459 [Salvia splendens]